MNRVYVIVTKKKPIRCEKTKLETEIVITVCGSEVCSWALDLAVIGHYTINIPEIFQVLTVF